MGTTTAVFLGGIIGAVLSSVANFLLQWAADRRRWKREDQVRADERRRENLTRHHNERLAAYRDFLSSIDEGNLGFVLDIDAGGYWINESREEKGIEQIASCLSEVSLLASSHEVTEASQEVWRECSSLSLFSISKVGQEPIEQSEMIERLKPLFEARRSFLKAAKKELGIEMEEN